MSPAKLTIIDDTLRSDHSWLEVSDNVAFIYEYISGAGYKGGPGNDLISNIQISPTVKGQNRYFYKERDMGKSARLLSEVITVDFLLEAGAIVVPAPSSKLPDHPEYDDRMLRICNGLKHIVGQGVDVRELVQITESREAQKHGSRLKVPAMIATMRVNENVARPTPRKIMVVDDVLTNGTTFKAMQAVLKERFPHVEVFGVFLARVRRPAVDWPDLPISTGV